MRFYRARGDDGLATRATWTPEGWRCHCGALRQCPSCGTWWRGRGAANGWERMVPEDDMPPVDGQHDLEIVRQVRQRLVALAESLDDVAQRFSGDNRAHIVNVACLLRTEAGILDKKVLPGAEDPERNGA